MSRTRDEIRELVLKKLNGRSKLATLIGVVRRVEKLVGSVDTSASELSEVISSDAVLTSRLLQVVKRSFDIAFGDGSVGFSNMSIQFLLAPLPLVELRR